MKQPAKVSVSPDILFSQETRPPAAVARPMREKPTEENDYWEIRPNCELLDGGDSVNGKELRQENFRPKTKMRHKSDLILMEDT